MHIRHACNVNRIRKLVKCQFILLAYTPCPARNKHDCARGTHAADITDMKTTTAVIQCIIEHSESILAHVWVDSGQSRDHNRVVARQDCIIVLRVIARNHINHACIQVMILLTMIMTCIKVIIKSQDKGVTRASSTNMRITTPDDNGTHRANYRDCYAMISV